MAEVHQAPSGGKGGDPPAVLRALRRFVAAAHGLRDAWSSELEGPTYPRALPSFGGLVRELDVWLDEAEARIAAAIAGAGEVQPLDLDDREAVRAWLADLRAQVDDVVAAGEDATRPPARRMLGRPMARHTILEARHALGQLLAAADRAMGERDVVAREVEER